MPELSLVSLAIGAGLTAFGAVLQAVLQHFVWKREQKSIQEREKMRERERTAERFREIGRLVIEISREHVSGPHIDLPQLSTTTLIEKYRLRRELLTAMAAIRDAFPHQQRLTNFQTLIMQKTGTALSEQTADTLIRELDAIVAELEKQ